MNRTMFDCRVSGFGRRRRFTTYVPNDQSPFDVITRDLIASRKGDSAEWIFDRHSPFEEAIYFGTIWKGDKVVGRGFLHIPLDY